MKPAVGLPIALDAEALPILGVHRWRSFGGRAVCVAPLPRGMDLLTIRSGVGLANAYRASLRLLNEGAEALVSMGVAGGLHPDLLTGDIIVGDEVTVHGSRGVHEPDVVCTELAYSSLLSEGVRARRGSILSVNQPMLGKKEKGELYSKTHALVCDMESGSIARAAAESNVPFVALRVVVDPAQKEIRPGISGCLNERGGICFQAFLKSVYRQPSMVIEALRMSEDLVVALSALRRAWRAQMHRTLPSLIARPHQTSGRDRSFGGPAPER